MGFALILSSTFKKAQKYLANNNSTQLKSLNDFTKRKWLISVLIKGISLVKSLFKYLKNSLKIITLNLKLYWTNLGTFCCDNDNDNVNADDYADLHSYNS